ncbi:MAG: type II toxin-antitoxin system VapC family toxin [Candidatus Lokiarchaeota archaeon]|nr:type II toxin-antitoxin system VapC family toxin [Candidatus Lokiarchaeota archaeon]
MKGIDSNVIIYALNKDLPEHEPCRVLLEKVAKGLETIAIPAVVLMESYHVLVRAYKFAPSEVKKRLVSIIESENITILGQGLSSILLAFDVAEDFDTGGRDSLIAACLLENNIKEIYSHDSDFDKIRLIKRIDPV